MILDNDNTVIKTISDSQDMRIMNEVRRILPDIWNMFETVRYTRKYDHDYVKFTINNVDDLIHGHINVYIRIPKELRYNPTKDMIENQQEWLPIIYQKIHDEVHRVFKPVSSPDFFDRISKVCFADELYNIKDILEDTFKLK